MSFDCVTCGACCAFSRYWPALRVCDPADGAGIPDGFLDRAKHRMRCVGDRCSALEGTVGERARCQVYENRPAGFRAFPPGGLGCQLAREDAGIRSPRPAAPGRAGPVRRAG